MISQQATQTVNVMTKAGIIRDQGQTGGWNDGGGKARPQSQRCVTGAWGRLAPIASERALTAHRHHRPEFTQLASFSSAHRTPPTHHVAATMTIEKRENASLPGGRRWCVQMPVVCPASKPAPPYVCLLRLTLQNNHYDQNPPFAAKACCAYLRGQHDFFILILGPCSVASEASTQ